MPYTALHEFEATIPPKRTEREIAGFEHAQNEQLPDLIESIEMVKQRQQMMSF